MKAGDTEFTVSRTARKKSVALRVRPDGRVEVLAPRFVPQAELRRMVLRKAEWIAKRRRYFLDLTRQHPIKEIKNGESFPVLGRSYRLKVEQRPGLKVPYCRAENRRLKVHVDGQAGPALETAAWSALRAWYSTLTAKTAAAAIRKHAQSLAVAPRRVALGDQTRRWASCSAKGDIRFNWRLSMMPWPVLEYIVVHELCHLKHHNHSARFWSVLKSVLPDLEKRQEWLKLNGGILDRVATKA